MRDHYFSLKNIHLLISISIVVPTAFIYGLSPTKILPNFLDINVNTIDLANMLRSLMCLYLAISFIWFLGISKPKFWKVATQLNILFMASLAFGRLLSLIFDGKSSNGFIFGILAEFFLAVLGIFLYRKFAEN